MNLHSMAFAALTLSLCGCAAPSSLKQVWKDPTYHAGPVHKIAVLGVDERELYRASVESHFSFQLNQGGQDAFMTHDLLPLPAIQADKQAAADKLRECGADTLLLVRLAGANSSTREVQATSGYYAPVVAGYESGDWYACYSVAFMDLGTTWSSTTQDVCLEISLFDLKTSRRLWSGITETMLKDDADRVGELTKLVTKVLTALRKDGLVH